MHHKTDFADTIELKVLRWGDKRGGNHSCPDKTGRGRFEEGLEPGMEGRKRVLETGKGKEADSASEPPEGGQHLELSPGKMVQTSGLPNCRRARMCCLKPPTWWRIGRAAAEHEHASAPPEPGHSAGTLMLTSTAFFSPDVFRP